MSEITSKRAVPYQNIYDAAPVGVCITENGISGPAIIYANKALQAMTEIIIGMPLEKAFSDPKIMEAAQKLKPLPEIEIQMNKNKWVQVTASYADFGGRPACIFWVTDVSKLRQAALEAQRMIEMKTAFLATMSHEIRTPMQSVYGLLELIADEVLNKEVMEMVLSARRSASGLLEILDDILDLAKVESGKMELDIFEVPLRTLAYGVFESLEIKAKGKPIDMVVDVAADVPSIVVGDPTRIRQILINLVGNALKFTEKGSVTLRITKNMKHITPPADGIALRFEIIDSGIGMDKEAASRLFKPFMQADNSTTRKYGGTGLGLSICGKLVELMQGKIGVDSTAGEGSTFWFEIPTQALGSQTVTELPKLDGLAILSVEDHPKGAKEIYNSLRAMGAEVISVPTYNEAIELIRKRPFDVAVVDEGLPDGSGLALLKEATKLRPFMGQILYTALDDTEMQHSARVIGAKYLSKPASRLGLGEAVKAAAKQKRTGDQTRPKRLLIAEDTPAVRDVLRRQLEKLKIDADFVINGAEAYEALKEKKHGIIFTDLHMPEMDGYQLAAKIRGDEEKAGVNPLHRFPVIVLTADVQLAQKQAYLTHGFDECLLKPVSLGQFRQLLIRWGVMNEEEMQDGKKKESATTEKPSPENEKPAVDVARLTEYMGGFDKSTVEMLGMFSKMTEPVIENLRKAHAEGTVKQLAEVAHSLKGSARSACCMVLGDLAHDIQKMGDEGQKCDTAKLDATLKEFDRVRKTIEKMAAEFK